MHDVKSTKNQFFKKVKKKVGIYFVNGFIYVQIIGNILSINSVFQKQRVLFCFVFKENKCWV